MGAVGPNSPPEDLFQEIGRLQRALRTSEERTKAALDQLASNELSQQEAGMVGEVAMSRPAVADFRRLARTFTEELLRLPSIRRRAGPGAVRLKVADSILPDLALLELESPRGVLQVQERERVRRFLMHPGIQSVLSMRGPAGDYARALVMERVAELYLRPSARRVFEKASEHYDEQKGRKR